MLLIVSDLSSRGIDALQKTHNKFFCAHNYHGMAIVVPSVASPEVAGMVVAVGVVAVGVVAVGVVAALVVSAIDLERKAGNRIETHEKVQMARK